MLEPDTLEQIANENSAQSEHRAWVRYPYDLDSVCQPLAGARGLQWPGEVRNLSAGGIAVRLARRFEAGTVLAMDLARPGRKHPADLVRARHACHVAKRRQLASRLCLHESTQRRRSQGTP